MESTSYAASKNSDLFKKTLQKLGKDKLSKPLRNELKQVNGELAEATKEYFKYKLVVDFVKKFLDQNVEKKVKNKEQAVLSDPLYLNTVKKYCSEDGIQPFGITEDFIDKTISCKQKTQNEKEELNKFVEDEVYEFCVKICEYTGCAKKYRKVFPQRAFQESMKDLSSELNNLAIAKCNLESDEEEINNLISNYYENLLEGVSMLKSLISLHEKKLEFQSSLTELYESREKTLTSKINCFEYQVLDATYRKNSILALTKIRAELEEKKALLDNNINSTSSELQEYLVLGPEYDNLVEEYTELLKQIRNEKWSLEALKRRKSFGGSLSDIEELINNCEQEAVDNSMPEKAVENSKVEETVNGSKVEETVDNSRHEETADGSRLEETAKGSMLEETVDGSTLEETGGSVLEETGGSVLEETVDGSVLKETVDASALKETVDGSVLEETVDGSLLEEIVDGSRLEEIIFSSTLRESVDCSTLEETVDN